MAKSITKNKKTSVTKSLVVKKSGTAATRVKNIPSEYALRLNLADGKFESKGKTFFIAIEVMNKDIKKAGMLLKSKAELILSSGGKRSHMLMRPFQMKRLLIDKNMQEIIAKRMSLALK